MGKRKRESEDRDDYKYLLYEIKKLKKELKDGRRRRRHVSESRSRSQSPMNIEGQCFCINFMRVFIV